MKNKKFIIIAISFLFLYFVVFVGLVVKERNDYKKARAKCPDYGYPYEKEGFRFGPGVSDDPEFIDCGGNLVIEKIRDLFVPNSKYLYGVENYRLDTYGGFPAVIIYSDDSKRFNFLGNKLYVFSTYEGSPAYYILNTDTGMIENKYKDLNQASQFEKNIFLQLVH